MRVIAFNGSPRRDGNTYRLLQHVFKALNAEGVETELVQLGGNLIHGKGIGALRETVHAVLRRTPGVVSFTLAPPNAGGWGATIVELMS